MKKSEKWVKKGEKRRKRVMKGERQKRRKKAKKGEKKRKKAKKSEKKRKKSKNGRKKGEKRAKHSLILAVRFDFFGAGPPPRICFRSGERLDGLSQEPG